MNKRHMEAGAAPVLPGGPLSRQDAPASSLSPAQRRALLRRLKRHVAWLNAEIAAIQRMTEQKP